MSVDLLVRATVRTQVSPAMRRGLRAATRTSLRTLGRARSSVTILLTDDVEIRTLNRDYRDHDRATDVLSFHLQELSGAGDPAGDEVNLGDIVISVETARRRAGRKRLHSELLRLATHGLCHLFGHDHQRPGQAKIMFALERRLLRLSRSPKTSLVAATPERRQARVQATGGVASPRRPASVMGEGPREGRSPFRAH